MPRYKKPVKVLMSQIKSGAIFKLTGIHSVEKQVLTLDGVYFMVAARGDHGRIMRIYDMATTRLNAIGTAWSGPVIDVPSEQARTIESYLVGHVPPA